ncbi:MAG TPA: heme ABC transporter substrate-binding protein IsdE [Virgibacillus sp.]|nr:heme ABC transporter substrate-binding protein IsdE [Virgibacillus sp.]
MFVMLIGLLTMAVGCSSSGASSADEKETDDNSNEATSEADIVSTTVALTEITDELDLDLVGVPTSYKHLPDRYQDAEEVGMAMDPDMEIIQSLHPDDVLSVSTLEDDVSDAFEKTNTPVTFVDLESVDGMYDSILDLGEKYDRNSQAEELVDEFKQKLSDIETSVQDKEPPNVLILLGVPGSYLVATENSYVGDLVKRAGGENAIQGEDAEYISSNTEHLQQSNPDIILRMAHGMPEEVVEMFDEEFKENDIWKHFKAVQDGRVYDLEETRFGTTANLAAPEALEELIDILYSEEAD